MRLLAGTLPVLVLSGVVAFLVTTRSDSTAAPSPAVSGLRWPPRTGDAHKPLGSTCAPAADTFEEHGWSLHSPQERSHDLDRVTLVFCTAAVRDLGSVYVSADVFVESRSTDATPAERAADAYEQSVKEAEWQTGDSRALPGVGQRASFRIVPAGGSSQMVDLLAVDGNLTLNVRLTVAGMPTPDAVALAADLAKAYIKAT